MEVESLGAKGLLVLVPRVFRDERGYFLERYNLERFAAQGLPDSFVQDNHSRSGPGVLRGIHYQHTPAQGKLVGVVRGTIWDVAVDLRPDSETYSKHFGIELSETNFKMLWIPAGFAHGFCVLGDQPADVIYKTDAFYNPAGEAGLHWADPDLAVAWPVERPIVSARDQLLASFAQYQRNPVRWTR